MSMFKNASQIAILRGNQVAAAAGSTININQGSSAFKDLSAAAAHTAMHNSAARFDAPRCYRNTRAKYLDKFELWMLGQGEDFEEEKRLIWLHGGAGAGKSAIMQSVVERCAKHGVILGTFFFSRADSSRNYAEVLIPTLAYQVASSFPEAMDVLEPMIHRNPLIFKASIHDQTYELLVRPLLYLFKNGVIDDTGPFRRVFVVDGLDECSNPQKQRLLIREIGSILCDHHLPINFVISSRPELEISSAFEEENQFHPFFTAISLDNNHDARSDIRQYIEDSFLNILDSHPWRMHIKMPWPSPESIDRLVEKSSGHFIYAATAMKFIASSDEHPPRALEVVEGIAASRTGSPFAELDALYMHILSSATYSNRVLDILRHCYFSYFPDTVASVCRIHDVSPADIFLFLSDVQSLVTLVPNSEGDLAITPKHASLQDFLSGEDRSQGLYITREAYHASLLTQYFRVLDSGPQAPTSRFSAENDLKGLFDGICNGLLCSENTTLVQSLVSGHVPNDIWKFSVESLYMSEAPLMNPSVKDSSSRFLCNYMRAIRNSPALHDDALYFHHFQMYIERLLDDISDIAGSQPQYRVMLPLMFSLGSSRPALVDHLLTFWNRHFHINDSYRRQFEYLMNDDNHKVDPRAFEVIERLPQGQRSWSADMAFTMRLILHQLIHFSWHGPSKLLYSRASPHRQWLLHHNGRKHISLGSPKLASAVSRRIVAVRYISYTNSKDVWNMATPPFLLSCWYRLVSRDQFKHLIRRDKRGDCLVLLKVVMFYLRKTDCTSEVARLARRLLPMVTQWHPKTMRRARTEMDAYVQRWQESPDGLLERAQALSMNDMD